MRKTRMGGVAASLFDGRRWTEDEARQVLAAQEASGESILEFAAQLRIDSQRLYWWRRRLGRVAKVAGAGSTRPPAMVSHALVPVTVRGVAENTHDAAAVVVSLGAVKIEVREVDAATASWVSLLFTSLGGTAS